MWRHDITASTYGVGLRLRIERRSFFHQDKGVVKSTVKILQREDNLVAQQPSVMAYWSRNFLQEARSGASSRGPDTISAARANESLAKRLGAGHKSAAGLLLMDSSLNLISFNTEAVKVLSYPDNLERLGRLEDFLAGKVRSTL